MKKFALMLLIIVLVLTSLVISCNTKTTSSTQIQTPVTTQSSQTAKPSSSTQAPGTTPAATVSTTPAPPTSATAANWWDKKWGTPKYGGTITITRDMIPNAFDPYNPQNTDNNYFNEPIWMVDPTLDRTKGDYSRDWVINTNWKGNLAESWEWTDPQTMVVKLRQNVYWQKKAPMNGRQLTADDVVFHYDRELGTGSGFTKPSPFGHIGSLQKVTAQDKFTLVYKFGSAAPFSNAEAAINQPAYQFIEAPEVYKMGQTTEQGFNSALMDWKNCVGTGPFIIQDLIAGSSVNYTKNPDYWGYDERYPKNKLPYADTLTVVSIPDPATKLAALRTGKIVLMDGITWRQAETIKQSNPDLLSGPEAQPGEAFQLRCDRKPFSDINVRKALQLSLDLQTIAKNYFGGTVEGIPSGLVNPSTGFGTPFSQWSADLQQEYTYNIAKAKQLMVDAGYPNGIKVTCDASPMMADIQYITALKAYFAEIQVDMQIQTFDPPTMFSLIISRKHDDMVAMGMPSTMAPFVGMLMSISTEPTCGIMQNDPVYDQLVKDAGTSSVDMADAKKRVNEADQYFIKKHWAVVTFDYNKYIFWQPYFKGYSGEKLFINNTSVYWARDWIDK